jgi:hypothetical protein
MLPEAFCPICRADRQTAVRGGDGCGHAGHGYDPVRDRYGHVG